MAQEFVTYGRLVGANKGKDIESGTTVTATDVGGKDQFDHFVAIGSIVPKYKPGDAGTGGEEGPSEREQELERLLLEAQTKIDALQAQATTDENKEPPKGQQTPENAQGTQTKK